MNHVMNTYGRQPLTLLSGKGSRVWDDKNNEYLDFVAGIAVNTLGHAHPRLIQAIAEQAATMLHCSNLYHIPKQIELAERLCQLSGLDRAFFCNSGAEANEAAIKLARKFFYDQGLSRFEVITAKQSFHGRTMQTIAATCLLVFIMCHTMILKHWHRPSTPALRRFFWNPCKAKVVSILPRWNIYRLFERCAIIVVF